jgi:hypothetical protein
VLSLPQGALIAAVDGLGHGREAANAARRALMALQPPLSASADDLIRHCHQQLRGTRGAVLSLALLDARENTLCWNGVGNIDGILLRASDKTGNNREYLLTQNGVLGHHISHTKHARILPLSENDTLIFTTDGIKTPFIEDLDIQRDPQELADDILEHHAKNTDDALALVVRYTKADS